MGGVSPARSEARRQTPAASGPARPPGHLRAASRRGGGPRLLLRGTSASARFGQWNPRPPGKRSEERVADTRHVESGIAREVGTDGMRSGLDALLIALLLVSSDAQAGHHKKHRKNSGSSESARRSKPAVEGLALTRGPYLLMGSPTAMTIRWRTNVPTPSLVRYGTSPRDLALQAQDPEPTTEHEVRLIDLRPQTLYYYTVAPASSTLADASQFRFRSAPPIGAEQPVRVWLIGDSGLPGKAQQQVQAAYDTYSEGAGADVWLLLGDNAYSAGTDAQYQAGFFRPYRERLRSTVLWPCRGNHDVIRKGPGNDYYDFFTLPKNGESGGLPSGTEAYYSFDYANVHFVCLDAEKLQGAAGNAMVDWLRADLSATRQDWVVAYWHHPPYSRGSHDSDQDGVMTLARKQLLPVLEKGGADVVVCGHSHSYERSPLINGHYGSSQSLERSMVLDSGTGDPQRDGPYRKPSFGSPAPHEGTVYVVVGSSSKLSPGPLDHPAHVKSLPRLGSLAMEVSGNRLDAAFLDHQGRTADRFTIVKGDSPGAQRGSVQEELRSTESPTESTTAAGRKAER